MLRCSTIEYRRVVGIVGRRCVAVTRLVHQLAGEARTPGCALEIRWATGEVLVLDENTDLTLSVSSVPWSDPYANCDPAQLATSRE